MLTPGPAATISTIIFFSLEFFGPPKDIDSKSDGPTQPKIAAFPVDHTISKKKTNRFNPAWYKRYRWISYSISQDKVYCYACIFFGSVDAHKDTDTFTKTGYNK